MNEQIINQESVDKESQKIKNKQKFRELSPFWKIMVVSLPIIAILAISATITYFIIYIYPLLEIMGV